MRSSSGAHFIALDHVRALAAYMVVAWHFTHGTGGFPVPFDYLPAIVPFALLDEGHTGVALFMTLSGYLFAKLLDGKAIRFSAFLWNRALRLLPLLVVVIGLVGLNRLRRGDDLGAYAMTIVRGLVFPTLPNGGWSITVEAHYYVLLPLLLWMLRRSTWLPWALVGAFVALRTWLYVHYGDVQFLAYWTILGRIDQFTLGMIGFGLRRHVQGRHLAAGALAAAFCTAVWLFDRAGGFYGTARQPLWVLLPTIEGLAYAVAIAWYDTSFTHTTRGLSAFVARLGEYSYSIYLTHYFIVFPIARFVHERVVDLSNFYVACAGALVFFAAMAVPGYLSFRFIEAPFLRLRKRYVVTAPAGQPL